MRILLAILVAVSLLPVDRADAVGEGETIRLLVPADARSGRFDLEATEHSETGWKRIEARIDGDVDATVREVERVLGTEVVVESLYRLQRPEDEPLFGGQWALENTGQTGGTADADIDASTAWDVSVGTGVVVAVVDSGVEATHPDLASQMWSNPGEVSNGIDDDGNGLIDDLGGWDTVDWDDNPSPTGLGPSEAHGTMVAGIVAGAVNGSGITGVAPGSRVMNLRACSAGACWSLDVANAIYYAVDEGADIINLSLGSPDTADVVMEAAIEHARLNDVLVVAAAGNEGLDVDNLSGGQILIPAGLPHGNILAVAASDDRDHLPSFSNYGPVSIDLAAPGTSIRTTGAAGLPLYVDGDGTSFAAPIVAGVAALLLSHDPGTGHQELIARIEGFADHPSGLNGTVKSGRVNAGATMTKRFIDTSASVFVNAIDWLAEEAITQGCNPPFNHMYCPGSRVTRGEMAVFLSRAFNLPVTNVDYFTDDDGRFYEGAANRLAAAGLTVGCGAGKYCGERDITREEMAAMLARALSLPSTETDYFADDENSIFEGAINRIGEASITQGCNPPINDRYCPTDKVTRGQMAAFIKRAASLSG